MTNHDLSPPPPTPPPPSETTNIILSTAPPVDPPPPYPSRERRSGRRRRAAATSHDTDHLQIPVIVTEPDVEQLSPVTSERISFNVPDPRATLRDTSEIVFPGPGPIPSLSSPPTPPTSSPRIPQAQVNSGMWGGIARRPRTLSTSSTVHSVVSVAPSFAQTVMSAFHPDRDEDLDPECVGILRSPRQQGQGGREEGRVHGIEVEDEHAPLLGPSRTSGRRKPPSTWYRYFRPVFKRAYYSALFHLLVLNFPYGLMAWVYLFVFTLTGTTTLMALPIGAFLCFLDLLGARILARGELALQTTFHGPLAFPAPFPPHPIFTRVRTPTSTDVEAGSGVEYERSFYRNAYAMFTDPTSYQSLFYFLVIKPAITLLLFISFAILVPLGFAFVFPAPAVLRLARRLGIWQANVAVEGLWFVR